MWREILQKYGTRAWAYRVDQGWVFGELTSDELEIFKSLSPYRTGTSDRGSGTVRFPIRAGSFFGGDDIDVAAINRIYRWWFAYCSLIDLHSEFYKGWLWNDQATFLQSLGCTVTIHHGYGWHELTPPTKSPPRLYSKHEHIFVYALVSPLIHKAFYVGETYDPQQRLVEHLHDTSNHLKFERIQQLHAQGRFPLLMILEEVSVTVAQERESWWIAYYWTRGHDLTNYCCQVLKKSFIR